METGGKMTAKNVHEIHKTLPMMTIARTFNSVEEVKKNENKKNRKGDEGTRSVSMRRSQKSKSKSKSKSQSKSLKRSSGDAKSETRLMKEEE